MSLAERNGSDDMCVLNLEFFSSVQKHSHGKEKVTVRYLSAVS